ncbi:TPA: hypothetical protein ACTXAA_000432 [Raoultella planticola]|uniref:hypothetical protein n=1 Tax=Klebsiella grimontii TaxID=2058152 RepID=UPI0011E47351|nr:hypothetical protein [Klebsiella grimontii]TYF92196.1 hypothetical protein DJ542_12755 [Klebsiella grimontii]
MLNPHTLRIIIWLMFSLVGCALFCFFYSRSLKRAYSSLHDAKISYDKAKDSNTCGDNVEAHHRYKVWQNEVASIKRQRAYCLLATPGILAIIALIFW